MLPWPACAVGDDAEFVVGPDFCIARWGEGREEGGVLQEFLDLGEALLGAGDFVGGGVAFFGDLADVAAGRLGAGDFAVGVELEIEEDVRRSGAEEGRGDEDVAGLEFGEHACVGAFGGEDGGVFEVRAGGFLAEEGREGVVHAPECEADIFLDLCGGGGAGLGRGRGGELSASSRPWRDQTEGDEEEEGGQMRVGRGMYSC